MLAAHASDWTAGQIEGDAQIRMRVVRQSEFGRIGDGVVDASVGHSVEQRLGVGAGILHPHQVGQRIAGRVQGLSMRAAGGDFQVSAADFSERTRPHRAAPIDQVFAHPLVCRTEFDAWNVLRGHLQARRRQMRVAGGERRIDFGVSAHRSDLEFHSELIGEAPRQFILRTLRHFVRSAIIGERAIARDHPQFAESLDLVDQARQRRAGAQQGDGRHRNDDFGPALPIDVEIQITHGRETLEFREAGQVL